MSLKAELDELESKWKSCDEACVGAETEDERERHYAAMQEAQELWHELARKIVAAHAKTSYGAAIKLRVGLAYSGYREHRPPSESEDAATNIVIESVRSVLRTLDRLVA